jgi:hypothetical protein
MAGVGSGGEQRSPATCERARGRVVLDVGGTAFVSSATSLERSSSYFRSLLARWDEEVDEPLFIDADADAFAILLSYMRVGTLTLPKHDDGLCVRTLLQAEYLMMEDLLMEVKARAYANMHGAVTSLDDARTAASAFDREVGSLSDALAAAVLPARFFGPPPPPPRRPPPTTVRSLRPAAPGYRALFATSPFDFGVAREWDDNDEPARIETLPIISFAVVE